MTTSQDERPQSDLYQDLREQLLQNELSHSQSINTLPSLQPDYLISEDLLAGQRCQGRMSNVRRFFCLFVTFDLLFVALMWLICAVLNGTNIIDALKQQIYHYNVHSSLFDVVLASICRFVVLLLFYALLYIKHWIVIAISTTLSSVFLMGKVFVYNWPQSSQPVFEVLLILISFTLCWGETWFLDFKVLPQELNASRYLVTNVDSERAPLIRSYVNGLPSQTLYTESTGNFYSPLQSPDGSLYRIDGPPVLGKYPPARLSAYEVESYHALASNTFQDAWNLLKSEDWKIVKQNGEDVVYSLVLPEGGKIYKVTSDFNISPKCLLEELFYKIENIPKWNSALLEAQKVQIIDEQTDISYQLSASAAHGMIASREFVMLRHWQLVDNSYVIANISTDHPNVPKSSKYVRGEHDVGCIYIQVIEEDSNRCHFEFVLNTNLKLRIPRSVLDKALIGTLFDYVKCLKGHIHKLREKSV